MRVFLFTCLLGIAVAAPQQGYNYQQQQGSFSVGLPQIGGFSSSQATNSFASSSSSSHSSGQEGQSFLQQALQTPKLMQTLLGGGGGGIAVSHQQQSFGQAGYAQQRPQVPSIIPQSFGIAQLLPQQQQFFQQNFNRPAPVVTKDIYVHVAPEEPEERFAQPQAAIPQPPRKHYRIVFIKAPTPKFSSSSALRLQQAPTEEKTIIYVLTKKPDPLDLETAIQEAAPKPPSKPEVYFIKYKTQEEAQHAQRTIQAQYDKLGGTTQITDEGVAPVTSVIGALDQSAGGAASNVGLPSSSSGSDSFSVNAPSSSYGAPQATGGSSVINVGANKYLPPIVRL